MNFGLFECITDYAYIELGSSGNIKATIITLVHQHLVISMLPPVNQWHHMLHYLRDGSTAYFYIEWKTKWHHWTQLGAFNTFYSIYDLVQMKAMYLLIYILDIFQMLRIVKWRSTLYHGLYCTNTCIRSCSRWNCITCCNNADSALLQKMDAVGKIDSHSSK